MMILQLGEEALLKHQGGRFSPIRHVYIPANSFSKSTFFIYAIKKSARLNTAFMYTKCPAPLNHFPASLCSFLQFDEFKIIIKMYSNCILCLFCICFFAAFITCLFNPTFFLEEIPQNGNFGLILVRFPMYPFHSCFILTLLYKNTCLIV